MERLTAVPIEKNNKQQKYNTLQKNSCFPIKKE